MGRGGNPVNDVKGIWNEFVCAYYYYYLYELLAISIKQGRSVKQVEEKNIILFLSLFGLLYPYWPL